MITKEQILFALSGTSTMGEAVKKINVDWRTFKKYAEQYGLYDPKKYNRRNEKYDLKDILNGLHPQYPTSKLSKRLIKENIKKYECEICGINEWNGKKITLELNHIDGDNSNHKLINLELICPNCHSQTDTYRSKGKNKKYNDENIKKIVNENNTYKNILRILNLGYSYQNIEKMNRIFKKYNIDYSHFDKKENKPKRKKRKS